MENDDLDTNELVGDLIDRVKVRTSWTLGEYELLIYNPGADTIFYLFDDDYDSVSAIPSMCRDQRLRQLIGRLRREAQNLVARRLSILEDELESLQAEASYSIAVRKRLMTCSEPAVN